MKTNKKEMKQIKKKKIEDLNRINTLLLKYRKIIGARYDTKSFNEPVLFLIRNNGKIETYDKALSGDYQFIHSDGQYRNITLKGKMLELNYFDRKIKCWLQHEDFPYPFPECSDPLVTSEFFSLSKDKDLNDVKNYQAQTIKERSNFMKSIAIIIAVVLGGIILYGILIGFDNNTVAVATTVAKNTTEVLRPVINHTITLV